MAALDKSLDEIISEKRGQFSRDRPERAGRNERSGVERRGDTRGDFGARRQRVADESGPLRRSDFLSRPAPAPYRRVVAYDEPEIPAARSAPTQEVRVRVEGLDPLWEAKDVREIFQEQGHNVVRIFMHWDRSGRSEGSCEMTMETLGQAKALVGDMDGAEVDGFPLTITMVRSQGGATPPRAREPVRDDLRDLSRNPFRDTGRDPFRDAPIREIPVRDVGRSSFQDIPRSSIRDDDRGPIRGSQGKGGNGGRGALRSERGVRTKEDLDAELDRMRR